MTLRNQLFVAAENVKREQNLSPVQLSTRSKHLDEQLKLDHEENDVVNRSNRKNCVNLLRFKMDQPESSFSLVQYLQGRSRTRGFNKLSLLIINMKNSLICLM